MKAADQDFWLVVTWGAREARMRVKRERLFEVTLEYWPLRPGARDMHVWQVWERFEALRPRLEYLSVKLPRIVTWLWHHVIKHPCARVRCEGALDLQPERTAEIVEHNRRWLEGLKNKQEASAAIPQASPEEVEKGRQIISDYRRAAKRF